VNDITFIAPPVAPKTEADIQLAASLTVASAAVLPAAAVPPTTAVPARKLRVLIESPLAASSETGLGLNQLYGRAALRDSLLRGEAPMASHMLYAQTFVLDDTNAAERDLGMQAGFSWLPLVDQVAVYTDRGISKGMREGIRRAEALGVVVEERSLADWARG
jgi:hypothetical protein